MQSQQIRRDFLNYFKGKGHAVIPSSPVVPHDDPTLLFTNAGMNQFKDVFLGKQKRDYTKAATSQKCIRVGGKHNDLDNVGHTSRHLTFFEMLGNFSFGDYFKSQAIAYAWEVSTQVFQLDPEKIWITIFQNDDEAFELWKKIVPEKKIVRLGEKDNFWAMGDTGPCGPCSELLYDRGAKYGDIPSPKEDVAGERYFEFWNLVFMQFNRDASGKMPPLPKQSIDTGSGLERVVSLKMGVDNVFATDILRSLIAEVEKISGVAYKETIPAFHVIADHIRSLAFAIADGAQPSNVERGYVLRKILRRAVRYGRLLGLNEPFLAKILPRLVDTMGADYPELKTSQSRSAELLTLEEEAFLRTLKRGGHLLSSVITEAKSRPQKEITGEEAFKLKDTYGLPLEEVLLLAKDSHLTVNLDAYQLLEEKAKETSKAAHVKEHQRAEESFYQKFPATEFVGYGATEAEGTILGILVGGKNVESLRPGQMGEIILNKTPFYAEKGGQVGDTGELSHGRAHFTVTDCQNPYGGVVTHIGTCDKGDLLVGEPVKAVVESFRRLLIQNNHTATHLLHFALQQVLGSHIRQAGSLVEAARLRFDFNHHKAPSKEELHAIEDLVNDKIREDRAVEAYELSYDEAQKRSEIKQFFGEKYGSKVRVIDLDYSKELCGGTHAPRTGTIGYFRILKEGSIASGVRRIEAVTGKAAEEFVRHHDLDLSAKHHELVEENKKLQQQLKVARRAELREISRKLASQIAPAGSIPFLATIVPAASDELALIAEDFSSGVILLATKSADKCHLFLKVSADLVQKGVHANKLIQEISPLIGGSGGGRPDTAQAGGKNPAGLDLAFAKIKELLARVQ